MKLYRLRTKVKSPANAVLYPQGKIYDAIYDFAIFKKLDPKNLPKYLIGKCQWGISADQLLKLDYLHAYGNIPIFSNKFLETANNINLEMDFVKTTIMAEDVQVEFNIGRILNSIEILDHEKSKIGSGDYFLNSMQSDFFIARDSLQESVFAVSERFKDWASKNKLNIGYAEVTYS